MCNHRQSQDMAWVPLKTSRSEKIGKDPAAPERATHLFWGRLLALTVALWKAGWCLGTSAGFMQFPRPLGSPKAARLPSSPKREMCSMGARDPELPDLL